MMTDKKNQPNCGSASCLVDRLEETLVRQHKETKDFLGELIIVHISGLEKQLDTMGNRIKEYGDNTFPLLRQMEKDITMLQDDEILKWARRFRSNLNKIMIAVTIAAVLGGAAYFLFIYDTHGRPTEYQQIQGDKK